MRIIYLFSHDPFKDDGITKKVESQTNIWKKLGHEVKISIVYLKRNKQRKAKVLYANIFFRDNIITGPKNLGKAIKLFNPHIIYFRFETYKPFLSKIIKQYSTIIELNTDDISEQKLEAKQNIKNRIRLIYHLLTRNFILRYSKGFVAVSNEILALSHIKKYKKDNIVIHNSLNLVEYPILKRSDKGNFIPHILFMGTLDYPWHGIDKIIQLAQKTEDKLFFHIIGSDGKNYIDLKNVKFYGYLSREEYTKIVSKCDIGIGTLALHRKKMNETSALKVLEYLAYGLPIIIGNNDTAFFNIKRLPKWVLKLPNKENNVLENIDRIVDFCYEIKNYVVWHKDVKKYIDSLKLEKQRMEFFKKILQEA